MCCPYAPEPNTQVSLSCYEENWYLDFTDAPFIAEMSATCTQNSTWVTELNTKTFCKDESLECVLARMPDCQDRTILCLDELIIPKVRLTIHSAQNALQSYYGFVSFANGSCRNRIC